MSDTKLCPDCTQVLPVGAFYQDKSKPSKLSTYCRRCMRRRSKLVKVALRVLRERHPDEFSAILAEVNADPCNAHDNGGTDEHL